MQEEQCHEHFKILLLEMNTEIWLLLVWFALYCLSVKAESDIIRTTIRCPLG